MLKSLITYLNLKLDLLNYFDLTRCLVELKEDSEGARQPVEYISNGDYDVINWDEFNGVSYWRLRDEITSERTEERKYKAGSRNNIETTVPLKLVFAVPRTKLTEDDAYSFDRIRQTMVKQFAIDDDVIKTTLQAESVRINVVTANSDAKDVWEDETGGTGTFEPKYETVFGSIDVDVVIISKHSCLPTECDDVESDILRSFDWCGNTAVTVGRLTEAQQTCISDFLCSCADATVQLNGSTIGTIPSGSSDSFPVLQDGSPVGSWNGSAWIVPPELEDELRQDYQPEGSPYTFYSYIGVAPNGSAEGDSVWFITRILHNANGTTATATAADVAWTDRLTATYT